MPARVNVTVNAWPGAGDLMRVNRICTGDAPPELLVPVPEDAKELLFAEDPGDVELPAATDDEPPTEEEDAYAADDDDAPVDADVPLADVDALLEGGPLDGAEVPLVFEPLLERVTPEEVTAPDEDDDDDDDDDDDVVDVDVDGVGQPAARSIQTAAGTMRRTRPMDRPPLCDARGALWTARNESNRARHQRGRGQQAGSGIVRSTCAWRLCCVWGPWC